MKNLIAVVSAVLLFAGIAYAGSECEVVSVRPYSQVAGGTVSGGHVSGGMIHGADVDIRTEQCASIVIKNTAGGNRMGAKVTVSFADGSTAFTTIGSALQRVDPGRTASGNECWTGKPPVTGADCSF